VGLPSKSRANPCSSPAGGAQLVRGQGVPRTRGGRQAPCGTEVRGAGCRKHRASVGMPARWRRTTRDLAVRFLTPPPPYSHVDTGTDIGSPVPTWRYHRPVESLWGPLSELVTCRAGRAATPRGGRAPGRGAGWHRTCAKSVQPPGATAGGDARRAGQVPQRPGAPGWRQAPRRGGGSWGGRGGVHRPCALPVRDRSQRHCALWAPS